MVITSPRVLVDTSVWIRSLAGREPETSQLRELLVEERVWGHELIHGELVSGDVGGRLPLLSSYRMIPWAPRIQHEEVVALVRERRLNGRGAGWIDLHLLASALVGGCSFWASDARLVALATELGIVETGRPGSSSSS